jgi:hypothetical protein
MSNTPQSPPPTVDQPPAEVVIISHSPLFYWWPVWAVGFLMAALTYWNGYQVAFVPPGTEAQTQRRVEGFDSPRDVLVAPQGRSLPAASDPDELKQPRLRMTPGSDPGIVWALTLFLVIVVTNIPLRGLWSLVVILAVVFAAIVLALLGLWDPILRAIRVIDIHITGHSYLAISLFLFVVWLLAFLFFDRLVYMVFARGQLRVRMAVSQGEMVYDTRGMVVERHRDDLFRHWLLGFGSGDLTVRTGGSSSQVLQLPNVLGINRKLRLIQTMLQEREVVRGSR